MGEPQGNSSTLRAICARTHPHHCACVQQRFLFTNSIVLALLQQASRKHPAQACESNTPTLGSDRASMLCCLQHQPKPLDGASDAVLLLGLQVRRLHRMIHRHSARVIPAWPPYMQGSGKSLLLQRLQGEMFDSMVFEIEWHAMCSSAGCFACLVVISRAPHSWTLLAAPAHTALGHQADFGLHAALLSALAHPRTVALCWQGIKHAGRHPAGEWAPSAPVPTIGTQLARLQLGRPTGMVGMRCAAPPAATPALLLR